MTKTRAGLIGGSIGGLVGGVVGLTISFLLVADKPELRWLGPFTAAFVAGLVGAVVSGRLCRSTPHPTSS